MNLLEKARHGGTSLRRNIQSLSRKLKVVAYDLILFQHAKVDVLCVLSCKLSCTRFFIECVSLVDRWKVLCDDLLPSLTHNFAWSLLLKLLNPLFICQDLVISLSFRRAAAPEVRSVLSWGEQGCRKIMFVVLVMLVAALIVG